MISPAFLVGLILIVLLGVGLAAYRPTYLFYIILAVGGAAVVPVVLVYKLIKLLVVLAGSLWTIFLKLFYMFSSGLAKSLIYLLVGIVEAIIILFTFPIKYIGKFVYLVVERFPDLRQNTSIFSSIISVHHKAG